MININDIIEIQESYTKYITIAQGDLNDEMFILLKNKVDANLFLNLENDLKKLHTKYKAKNSSLDKTELLNNYFMELKKLLYPLYNHISIIRPFLPENEEFKNPKFIEFATKISNLYLASSELIPKMLKNTKELKKLLNEELKKLS